jgi:hypothetical protein
MMGPLLLPLEALPKEERHQRLIRFGIFIFPEREPALLFLFGAPGFLNRVKSLGLAPATLK